MGHQTARALPYRIYSAQHKSNSGRTQWLALHLVTDLSDRFEEQARQAFQNIQTILEELGSSMDKIVKTTVFMVSGNDFSILNKVYGQVFPENAPARSTPQVMPFPAGILISIERIALK